MKIIDQARANSAHAQSQLELYVKAYNDALGHQRKAQNHIIALETRRTQVYSAIQGANDQIDKLKGQIADLEGARSGQHKKRTELLARITGEENTKAQLMRELEKINQEIAEYVRQLNLLREQAAEIEASIVSKER